MSLAYFKNPIILGILGAILSYVYLYWRAEQKHKEDKSVKREQVNILIPGAIGVIVWFIAATYFDNDSGSGNGYNHPKLSDKSLNNTSVQNMTGGSKGNTNVSNTTSVSEPSKMVQNKSYHLIGKNKVRLPPTDVFIDVAKF